MGRASRKTESLCVTEKNKVSSARAESTGRKTGAPQPGPGALALRSASPVTQACRRRPVRPRRESGESPSGRRPPLRAPPPDPASARTCALRAPRACSGCLQSGSFPHPTYRPAPWRPAGRAGSPGTRFGWRDGGPRARPVAALA